MSPEERLLLDRLAGEGKPADLRTEDVALAKVLEASGYLFMTGFDSAKAVITPKGRRLLVEFEHAKTNSNKPLSFVTG